MVLCISQAYDPILARGPTMPLDTNSLPEVLKRLGEALVRPATLCLIGSTPGIATGQRDRQTPDLNVWNPGSDYDAGDLGEACRKVGVLFDPKGEIDPDQIYVQVIRPGIVRLPKDFDPEVIARFGQLTVAMPPPELLTAAKLVRGSEVDIEDVVWWVRQRGLDLSDIQLAIDALPDANDRETATENIVYVQLVMGRDWK
jgi:hypothetical protein